MVRLVSFLARFCFLISGRRRREFVFEIIKLAVILDVEIQSLVSSRLLLTLILALLAFVMHERVVS